MCKTTVVNRHFEPYDIYIGRGTRWGNPFKEGKDGTREEVIELYRQYARNNPEITEHLHELKGLRLGCSCKPLLCHGDVLVEMIEMSKYNKIVVGIDQSYTRTGIGISVDGKLVKVNSIPFRGCRIKSEKRKELRKILSCIIENNKDKAQEFIIICERIRTFSHNNGGVKGEEDGVQKPGMFISTDYIKATGALIATIVDVAYDYGIEVYSVDTQAWKRKVLGNSKGSKQGNKQEAIQFIMKKGFDISHINNKGTRVYDDDAADAGCIALYGFVDPKLQKLKKEE